MAVNRFNTPAEQNLMQTYVPLPFQEMAAAAQMIQKRHDEGEALADALDDNILNLKPKRELDKRFVSDYMTNLDDELSNLITKHDGKYADMVPDLKLIQKRVNRDLTAGDLATVSSSGEQVGLYNQGMIDAQEEGTFNPYLNTELGAGREYTQWAQEGMKNIGTDNNPNWVLDEDYYQNNVIGQPLSSYAYTGVHKAADMLDELDKIFGKVKADSRELVYDVTDPDGTVRTVTEKVDEITPGKIANASINNLSSLSPGAQQELELWSRSLTDQATLGYADAFIQTLLSDEMLQQGISQEQVDELNERYNEYLDSMVDADGNLTPQAHLYAQAWNINSQGQKYIKGDTTYKDVGGTQSKYKKNGINQTHKYQIVDIGKGPEIQINPVVDEFGDDIMDVKDSNLMWTFNEAVIEDYSSYENALNEYLTFKESNPQDVDHLDELLNVVNAAQYEYESSAFTRQLITQQAAIDAGYQHSGAGATHPVYGRTDDNYAPGDITYLDANKNRVMLTDSRDFMGDLQPFRYNIDVIFDENGMPVDPKDTNKILNHVKNRTIYDENGMPTGFRPTGYGHDDVFHNMTNEEIYEYQLEHGYAPPNIDPDYADYSGWNSTVYESIFEDSPLDRAKVNIYKNNKDKLFGGRTRQITQLSGSGNATLDNEIATSITAKWMDKDFIFDLSSQNQGGGMSMATKPGGDVNALSDYIIDYNEDGKLDQDDVRAYIEAVKKGDERIFWESVPNSKANNGAGGYRGVIYVPIRPSSGNTFGKSDQVALYFNAPQAYTNEIMRFGMDEEGYYGPLSTNAATLKQMNYAAQIDLDRAIRQPGNIVPSSTMGSNNEPIGFYYFGTNPHDGSDLQSDEYIFVPNKNTLLSVKEVQGELVETRADGVQSIDVDDNTRDLGRILMLNDPEQIKTKKYWYGTLPLKPGQNPFIEQPDPVEIGFEKNDNNKKTNKNITPNNTVIGGNVDPNKIEDPDIVVQPGKREPETAITLDPIIVDEVYDPNAFPPEPIITGPPDMVIPRPDEEIIKLDPIPIDPDVFKDKVNNTIDVLERRHSEDPTIIDDGGQIADQDNTDLNYFEGNGASPSGGGFVGPGALVITQPGDSIYGNGAIMSDDYRIWDLTTGQQLDRQGKVVGPREYDKYYYVNDAGKTVEVDFSWQDGIDADGQPLEPTNQYDVDLDGTIIEDNTDVITPNPEDLPNEENDPDVGGDNDIPQTGAPNTIVPSTQTYNIEYITKNGNSITGTFTVEKGQMWIDDSHNVYNTWAMHRGGELIPQDMQVKQQLLDQLMMGQEKINGDYYDVFAGLFGDMGASSWETKASKHNNASITGWIDSEGNQYPYKGFPYGTGNDNTFYGDLPEGYTIDDLTLQYSENYNPEVHHRDGTVRDDYLDDRKQILNGNFPSLEVLKDTTMSLSDGTEGTFEELLKFGKISIMTRSGSFDPFRSGQMDQASGTLFNLPMADVWRSPSSQANAHDEFNEEGGSPTAAADRSFHVVGQAIDLSQKDYDYGIYLVDLTQGSGESSLGNNKMIPGTQFSTKSDLNMIQLDNIIHGNMRPWKGMDNELQKLVVQRLIDLNKQDGYSLAQLSADKVDGNEWWHFSIGEMTQYREPLMPGNIYGTYEYVR